MADNAHVDTLRSTTEPSSSISDTDSVSVTVLAVNDAPILTAPVSGGPVEEGDKVTFSSADDSKLIFVVDDALDEQVIQMQIAVTNGTATLVGLQMLATLSWWEWYRRHDLSRTKDGFKFRCGWVSFPSGHWVQR